VDWTISDSNMNYKNTLTDSSGSTLRPQAGALLAARAFLGVASLLAGYLAVVAISNGPLAGCGAGSGCHQVMQSRWAYWLHLPVSVPALLAYATLFILTLLAKKCPPDEERGTWAAIVVLSVVIIGAAFWFVGLQALILKSFCKFCLLAHGCGLAAAILCLRNIPQASDPTTPMWSSAPEKRGIPRSAIFSLVLIGAAGMVMLVGGQWLVPEDRNLVFLPATASATKGTSGVPAAPGYQSNSIPSSPNAHFTGPRMLSLYNDQFMLRLDEMPMIGSPGASNVIVNLFDYSCPHCQELHWILVVAQRQFGNNLGIVSLPMPMSTNCNPLIPTSFSSNTNACEFAHLGLAVWRAKPGVYRQFDDWMFAADPNLLTLEAAKKYAAQLVGADKLDKALSDPWVDKQILTDCQIHFANWQATGRPAMPQLILGGAISIGPLDSVEHLQALLGRYLDLHPARPAP